ncbi:hypothetical protein JHE00_23350 [Prauserella sp. ASG 168]|uniref:Uncharacterized protein n=1 Tax=Prauserella cavernicola TaxID=2800127 RepID=A0A934V722_9PSEU|nr:hypothetical protein [Prauserella cavernicola]
MLGTVGAGFTATAAEQTAAESWTVSHDGGSASGTATFVREGVIGGELTLDGTLRATDSGCYFANVTVVHDLAPGFYKSAEQCGQGTTPIDMAIGTSTANWTASIEICRTGGDCGQPQPIRG